MKKWLYLAALLATCYLNLVYDWPEGRTILVVELVFPAVLYLEAKLMSVRTHVTSGTSKVRNSSGRISLPAGAGTILKKRCAHSRLEKVLPNDLVYFPQSVVYR